MPHPIDKLDVHEVAALMRWKHEHGKRWKSALLQAWMRASYPGCTSNDAACLQHIRNCIGPSGLKRISLD